MSSTIDPNTPLCVTLSARQLTCEGTDAAGRLQWLN